MSWSSGSESYPAKEVTAINIQKIVLKAPLSVQGSVQKDILFQLDRIWSNIEKMTIDEIRSNGNL